MGQSESGMTALVGPIQRTRTNNLRPVHGRRNKHSVAAVDLGRKAIGIEKSEQHLKPQSNDSPQGLSSRSPVTHANHEPPDPKNATGVTGRNRLRLQRITRSQGPQPSQPLPFGLQLRNLPGPTCQYGDNKERSTFLSGASNEE